MAKKIILAYSGGLDTSVIVKWLQENYDSEIVAYCADLGQDVYAEQVEKKAYKSGASKIVIDDLSDEFIRNYAFPSLQASALYEGQYPLATALGRPLIAQKMVELARKEGADAVCHGCTGKGNDQVRFDLAFAHLAPDLEVIAPLRFWEFRSREEEINYCIEHGIPVESTAEKPYSLDMNWWGQSVECGVLEDPWNEAPENAFQLTVDPTQAPDSPCDLTISFEKGVPTHVDGQQLSAVEIVSLLHQKGCAHGIGRIDMVENRMVGIKSREIYEAPAATILHEAHLALEKLTIEKELFRYKQKASYDYANAVYDGAWFSPLRQSLQVFFESTQRYVTGEVKLRLFKGAVSLIARRSPYSLYDESLATYTSEDQFDHKHAEGFIYCLGLPGRVVGQKQELID